MIPEIRNRSHSQRLKALKLISLKKEDYVDNSLKYLNTWEGSTMSQQEGSSTVTIMTEQETMEKS